MVQWWLRLHASIGGTKTYMPWGVAKKKKKSVMKDLIVLLFFKIVSGILYSLHLGSFAIFYKKERKKACWDFDIDCIDLVDQFDEECSNPNRFS